jgi:hypothetical protein
VAAQRRLWEVSEELTATRYDFLASTNRTYASFVPAAAGPASGVRML